MKRLLIKSLYALFVLVLVSCSADPSLEKMEHIKSVGNGNPKLALIMLDSLELDVRESSEYVQNKYILLKVRLEDKADILPSSDIKIKRLLKYFEEEGTSEEKQEVYYYAGSVYRDLQDTPRALANFFKSIDYAEICSNCDSAMLRNTYSNLCFLQFRVQNYEEAIAMARQELKLSKAFGEEDIISHMHLGAAYKALDSLDQTITAYDKALDIITHSKDKSIYQEDAIRLLSDYSEMKQMAKAKMCKSYIAEDQPEYLTILKNMAYGCYYEQSASSDSAKIFYNRIIEANADLNNRYDAAKRLYHIYLESGDVVNANKYADIYMQLSDSLDFGIRQELAATVNNAHKYHLDEKKEQELKAGKEKYRLYLLIAILTFVVIGAALCLLYIRRRNIHIKRVIDLSSELERLSADDIRLHEDIENKAAELKVSQKQLEESNHELIQLKQELERLNSEYNEYDNALKEKEKQLSEKIEQNKVFIKLLHQSELQGKAEDVIDAIRQSTVGKKNMTSADWKQLYQAVDELYPDFKDKLLKELGTFTEQQMQVCYLMRIGLSKPQIQNMTNLSRVTVWRWVKKYDWALTSDKSF